MRYLKESAIGDLTELTELPIFSLRTVAGRLRVLASSETSYKKTVIAFSVGSSFRSRSNTFGASLGKPTCNPLVRTSTKVAETSAMALKSDTKEITLRHQPKLTRRAGSQTPCRRYLPKQMVILPLFPIEMRLTASAVRVDIFVPLQFHVR